jgi:hypothetical protein
MIRVPALVGFTLLGPILQVSLLCGQDNAASNDLRRYSDGPLEAEDFRGTVPSRRPRENGVILDAFTSVDIRYNLRYRGQTNASRTTLTLTSIDVYAVVDQAKSWNSQKSNRNLLDHEQGHFDLAAIYAIRMQCDFDKQLAEGRGIKTVGANEADAALALQREVDRLLNPAVDAMIKANERYDVTTSNGSKRELQQRERKQQLDELSRVVDELGKLRD